MKSKAIAAVACVCMLSGGVLAQEASFPKLLDGSLYPLSIPPSALTPDYVPLKIVSDSSGGGFLDMIMSPMMMIFGALGGGQQPGMAGLVSALDCSWTKGDTFTLAGQKYLVAYKIAVEQQDLMGPGAPDMAKSVLHVSYIKFDAIKNFAPRPDITKEKFIKALQTKIPKAGEKPIDK